MAKADASYLLVTPEMWGPMDEEQIDPNRMFHCEMCSDQESMVFHNILGLHNHRPAKEWREEMPDRVLH